MMLSLKLVRPLLFNRSLWRRTPKRTRRKQRIWPTKIRWQRLCLELEQLGILLPQKQFSNQKNLVQFRHLLSLWKSESFLHSNSNKKTLCQFRWTPENISLFSFLVGTHISHFRETCEQTVCRTWFVFSFHNCDFFLFVRIITCSWKF